MEYLTINQTRPVDTVSGKYTFLPTSKVIDDFGSLGWKVQSVSEARVNKAQNVGFQRHVVRLRHDDFNGIKNANGNVPEIVVVNSHDGKSAFKIMLGLFRMVCSNGLIVSDGMFEQHKVIHKGYSVESIEAVTNSVIEAIPRVGYAIENFSNIQLTDGERRSFADASINLRWDKEKEVVNPDSLLTVRRVGDTGKDLFTTYNVIQENMLRGGSYVKKTVEDKDSGTVSRKIRRARGITNIKEDIRINKALWELTEKMAELKG